MNSLENQEHKNRLQLFFVISMGAYFFWFSQLETPVQQPVETPVTESVAEGEGSKTVEKSPVTPTLQPKSMEKVSYHSLPYDADAFHFDITSTYGSPQFVGLREFTVLPEIQSWWGWIFSGMDGSWEPYTDIDEEIDK